MGLYFSLIKVYCLNLYGSSLLVKRPTSFSRNHFGIKNMSARSVEIVQTFKRKNIVLFWNPDYVYLG